MKTPIQELIDEMQKHYEWQHTTFQEKAGIAICMSFCMKKLAKEKQVIKDAFNVPVMPKFEDVKSSKKRNYKNAEEYYNETFKNEEK